MLRFRGDRPTGRNHPQRAHADLVAAPAHVLPLLPPTAPVPAREAALPKPLPQPSRDYKVLVPRPLLLLQHPRQPVLRLGSRRSIPFSVVGYILLLGSSYCVPVIHYAHQT